MRPTRHVRSWRRRRGRDRCNCAWSKVERWLGCILRIGLRGLDYSSREEEGDVLVSPASPEKAIRVCLFKARVLSSDALRTVAPRIAALEAATMVKSLPVNPSKTSLKKDHD